MIEEGIIGILGSVLGALSSWLAIRRTIRAPLESLQAKVEHLEREKLHGLATHLCVAFASLIPTISYHLSPYLSRSITVSPA